MIYTRADLVLQSEKPITINGFTGSTIRGAICYQLMKNCTQENKNCKECTNKALCTNYLLFNSCQSNVADTNPIIINVSYSLEGVKTNTISFELVLVGKGILAFNSLLDTFKLGIRIKNYSDKEYVTFKFKECNNVITEDIKPKLLSTDGIRVEIENPVILKDSMRDMAPESFMRAVLIRNKTIGEITNHHSELSYLQACSDVRENMEVKSDNLKEVNRERYSTRTHSKMRYKGLYGYIEYKGDFTLYAEQLAVAEKFNIGKLCSMGSGKIRITPL